MKRPRENHISFSFANNRRRVLPEGHKEITAENTFSVEEENSNKELRNKAHQNDEWFLDYRPATSNRSGHLSNLGHARRAASNHDLFGGLKGPSSISRLKSIRRKFRAELRSKLRSP